MVIPNTLNFTAKFITVMKKMTFLLATITFFIVSCNSDDDSPNSENPNTENNLNPPEWIQGKWLQKGTSTNKGIEFVPGKFCEFDPDATECVPEKFKGQEVDMTDESGENHYIIKFSWDDYDDVSYIFSKVSKDTLRWHNSELQQIYIRY